VVSQIIRESIAPQLRERGYAAGLQAGIDAVFARLPSRGAPPAPPQRTFGISPYTLGLLALIGIIALYLLREAMSGGGPGHGYTAGGRRRGGWSPPIFIPPMGGGGWGGGGRDSDSGPTFTPGGGSTGGGGAGGEW
jgi:uncharacterized protein